MAPPTQKAAFSHQIVRTWRLCPQAAAMDTSRRRSHQQAFWDSSMRSRTTMALWSSISHRCDSVEPSAASAWLDEMVLVVEAERTRIQTALHAKAIIERTGVRLAGVVLANRREHVPRGCIVVCRNKREMEEAITREASLGQKLVWQGEGVRLART